MTGRRYVLEGLSAEEIRKKNQRVGYHDHRGDDEMACLVQLVNRQLRVNSSEKGGRTQSSLVTSRLPTSLIASITVTIRDDEEERRVQHGQQHSGERRASGQLEGAHAVGRARGRRARRYAVFHHRQGGCSRRARQYVDEELDDQKDRERHEEDDSSRGSVRGYLRF